MLASPHFWETDFFLALRMEPKAFCMIGRYSDSVLFETAMKIAQSGLSLLRSRYYRYVPVAISKFDYMVPPATPYCFGQSVVMASH
jgi:hypothetical protein